MRSFHSDKLAQYASHMRASPTTTEALLWQQLSGSRAGAPFRRQVVIGGYIVDFLAPKQKLVVEVDGPYHERRARADARRDRKLARLGYRVLRIPAALVQQRLGEAVALVRVALEG
jgi:very-short-patch-repair endonuclease